MNNVYKVRQLGTCLVVTIPQQVSRALSLQAGSEVKIGIVGNGRGHIMTVEPQRKPKGKK